MKNILIFIVFICLCISVQAKPLGQIEYKNIQKNTKIAFINNKWISDRVRNDRQNYKKISANSLDVYSEYQASKSKSIFTLKSNYEFIYKGRLIGYSNADLKFYEYSIDGGEIISRELSEIEIQEIFPKFKIIKISDFTHTTNSLKIKKGKKDLRIILLNDTDASFCNYCFSTNNSEFELYELKGFVKITKTGMIQFSGNDNIYEKNAWYVLLVR